jgi:hypothetical protein
MAYRRNGIRRSGRSRLTVLRFRGFGMLAGGLIICGEQSCPVDCVNPSSLSGKWPGEPLGFRSVVQFQEQR